tara:strand:- start:3605 stop:3868 length:264 start_codon:yes stop_codon:yes gene_type:complete
MIRDRKEMPRRPIEIDLNGPDGNAFVLLSLAAKLGKQIGMSYDEIERIQEEMRLSTYDLLLLTFDKYFGEFVILYRDGGAPTDWRKA